MRNARAAIFDALAKNLSNCPVEMTNFGGREAICRPQRMDSSSEQCLVSVDIADSRDQFLIEKRRLDWSCASSEPVGQSLGREVRIERFGSNFAIQQNSRIPEDMDDSPELALIREPQFSAIVEFDRKVFKPQRWV